MSVHDMVFAKPSRFDSLDVPVRRGELAVVKHTRGPILLGEPMPEDVLCEGMVGRSEVLRNAVAQLETVAPTDSTVLSFGETGTGKELIDRAVHNLSERHSHAFVKCNCGNPRGPARKRAVRPRKGAFTGRCAADQSIRAGASRHVFLDEIGGLARTQPAAPRPPGP